MKDRSNEVESTLLESQVTIVRALLNELKFGEKPRVLIELIDQLGFSASEFPNPQLRSFYGAVASSYGRLAPEGVMPKFADVLLELESSGDPNISLWKQKFSEKLDERHDFVKAALTLSNFSVGEESESFVSDWLLRFRIKREGDKYYDVRNDIDGLVSHLVNIASRDEEDSNPKSIMEKAWAKGFLEPDSTGFTPLDREWSGGWRPRDLWCIAMPSGMGKTTSAVSFMCERVRQKKYSVYNSYELSKERIVSWALCNLSGVLSLEQVEHPDSIRTQTEMEALKWATEQLSAYARIYRKQVPVEEIPKRIRRHRAIWPSLNFFILDHVGVPESNRENKGDDWLELMKNAYYLKDNACEAMGCCGLIYSQVDKKTKEEVEASNRVSNGSIGRSSKIIEALDGLTFGGRHNGKSNGRIDESYLNTAWFQTVKNRRDGRLSYVGLRYNPIQHRLMNQEVVLQ